MRSELFLLGGAVAGAAAIISFVSQRSKFRRWHRATGIVVDVKKIFDGEDTMRAPVVRFTPGNSDTEIEFEETIRSSISFLAGGDRVQVLYDPTNPKHAILAGWRQHFVPVIWTVAAIIAFAASARR